MLADSYVAQTELYGEQEDRTGIASAMIEGRMNAHMEILDWMDNEESS